jgi:PAS domain S-box-containing protein
MPDIVSSALPTLVSYVDCHQRYVLSNTAHQEWFGFSPESVIGRTIEDIWGEEVYQNCRRIIEMALRGGTHSCQMTYTCQMNGIHPEKKEIITEVTCTPDMRGSIVKGLFLVASDITERKLTEQSVCEAEKALIEALRKADDANRAKSEFLTNMSHEIRTPMNAVVGLSNILAMNKNLPPQVSEMIGTLQLSAQSLMELINDLLDIAKIETNKIELEYISFQLGDVIKEVFSMLSVKAEEKHITLDFIPSPLEKQAFLGDPLRIRQIVINLVSNAIKFTETGGVTVSLSASPHEEPDHVYVHIAVADTGIGIPSNKLETIFDKFIQADTSTTRKYGGTGLGLAISKNLAEIMDGGITVKSHVGEGTEFTLHLPLQMADDKLASDTIFEEVFEEKEALNNGSCILLVEDYKPNILVAGTLLEGLGYHVATAGNGKEAIAKIRANREKYMAVLMDIQMPDMDGIEATHIIRQDEREKGLPRLPIIAITAHALQGDRERCLEAGMDGYISKPFRPEELQQAIISLDKLSSRPLANDDEEETPLRAPVYH